MVFQTRCPRSEIPPSVPTNGTEARTVPNVDRVRHGNRVVRREPYPLVSRCAGRAGGSGGCAPREGTESEPFPHTAGEGCPTSTIPSVRWWRGDTDCPRPVWRFVRVGFVSCVNPDRQRIVVDVPGRPVGVRQAPPFFDGGLLLLLLLLQFRFLVEPGRAWRTKLVTTSTIPLL